uniref:Uncharacterized protein n=1 Tax=Triticum urartu TaxID=4572 RepID=A0A8R7JXS1_TRIUA
SQRSWRNKLDRRTGAAAIHILAVVSRGRPTALEHHHHLRYSPPHPSVASPSLETRRRRTAADARDRRRRPRLLIVRSATRAIVRSVTF